MAVLVMGSGRSASETTVVAVPEVLSVGPMSAGPNRVMLPNRSSISVRLVRVMLPPLVMI